MKSSFNSYSDFKKKNPHINKKNLMNEYLKSQKTDSFELNTKQQPRNTGNYTNLYTNELFNSSIRYSRVQTNKDSPKYNLLYKSKFNWHRPRDNKRNSLSLTKNPSKTEISNIIDSIAKEKDDFSHLKISNIYKDDVIKGNSQILNSQECIDLGFDNKQKERVVRTRVLDFVKKYGEAGDVNLYSDVIKKSRDCVRKDGKQSKLLYNKAITVSQPKKHTIPRLYKKKSINKVLSFYEENSSFEKVEYDNSKDNPLSAPESIVSLATSSKTEDLLESSDNQHKYNLQHFTIYNKNRTVKTKNRSSQTKPVKPTKQFNRRCQTQKPIYINTGIQINQNSKDKLFEKLLIQNFLKTVEMERLMLINYVVMKQSLNTN